MVNVEISAIKGKIVAMGNVNLEIAIVIQDLLSAMKLASQSIIQIAKLVVLCALLLLDAACLDV